MFRNPRVLPWTCLTLLACLTVTARAAEPPIRLAGLEEAAREAVASPNTTATQPDAIPSELTYKPEWPAPPDTGAMLLRLCIGTAVVLGLCVGSLWLGKPWLMRLQMTNATGQPMQIEGTIALGNRAMLYLVKVGDTQLIAGTDATGLKSLLALPASFKDALDEPLPHVETVHTTEPPQLFASHQPAA